jgi:hypothetical protein
VELQDILIYVRQDFNHERFVIEELLVLLEKRNILAKLVVDI